MKEKDKKELYKFLYDNAKMTYNEQMKLENKLRESLSMCETTQEKELIMGVILKNCDKIDEACDSMKYYNKVLNDSRPGVN